jgi:hypothetical protein
MCRTAEEATAVPEEAIEVSEEATEASEDAEVSTEAIAETSEETSAVDSADRREDLTAAEAPPEAAAVAEDSVEPERWLSSPSNTPESS